MSDTDSDSSSDYDPFLANKVTDKPKQKHHCTTYRKEWEVIFKWIQRYEPNDGYAKCSLCDSVFSIGHGGAHDIKRHQFTAKHKRLAAEQGDGDYDTNDFNSAGNDSMTDSIIAIKRERDAEEHNPSGQQTKKPRVKHMTHYNTKWELDYPWLKETENPLLAECTVCNSIFSIGYRGIHDVIRHVDRRKHKAMLGQGSFQDDDSYNTASNASPHYSSVKRDSDTHTPRKYTKRIQNGSSQSSSSMKKKVKVEKDESQIEDDLFGSALYWDSFMTNPKKELNITDDDSEPQTDPIAFESFEVTVMPELPSKRAFKYNPDWERSYSWLSNCKKSANFAVCNICQVSFSVELRGVHDIIRHEARVKHMKLSKSAAPLSATPPPPPSPPKKRSGKHELSLAKAIHVFHSVMHSQSPASRDCANKLYQKMFPDSVVASKFSCQPEHFIKIVKNILVPSAHMQIMADLSNDHPFSIATDTRNRGQIGTFPLIVRYFNKTGVRSKLLTFFTPPTSETPQDLHLSMMRELESSGLSIANVTAFTADNSTINYGLIDSVFAHLQKSNGYLLPMNCLRRSIHNVARHAQNALKIDLEMIIYKCFNELCSSAADIPDELHELYIWSKHEWPLVMGKVPLHWLSLVDAISAFLTNFSALKSYFLVDTNAPRYVREFFQFELAACYLGLFKYVGVTFRSASARLEASEQSSAIDLYDAMQDLRKSLQLKRDEESYGDIARQRLTRSEQENEVLIEQFRKDAYEYFDNAIKQLELCYDFENTIFKHLSPLCLSHKPTIEELQQIVQHFNIVNVNNEQLLEEWEKFSSYYDSNRIFHDGDISAVAMNWWKSFLQVNAAPNLERICCYVFSLPISNSVSDRLSDRLLGDWQQDRNHRFLANCKAEIQVRENFGSMSCKEFSAMLNSTPVGANILQKITASSEM